MYLKRRHLLAASLALPAIRTANAASIVRMGFQKGEPILIALKSSRELETTLAPLGYQVSWTEFEFGVAMLEGMRAGAIDVGAVGDTPPIFAQASHSNLSYIAGQRAGTEGILLPGNSPVHSPADLKGKKIAVTRGSSSHNFLLRVLEKAGLPFSAIQPVYLGPADAGAAFQRGVIDGWSIWDPYFALFEKRAGVTTLITDAELGGQNSFFMARSDFVANNASITAKLVDTLIATGKWAQAHRTEVADQVAAATGIDRAAIGRAADRAPFQIQFMDKALTDSQQGIADRFKAANLIPVDVQVAPTVWRPNAWS